MDSIDEANFASPPAASTTSKPPPAIKSLIACTSPSGIATVPWPPSSASRTPLCGTADTSIGDST